MVYQNTRTTLQRQGLAAHKKRGQNFLVHRHTAERIVDLAGTGPDDTILEVGVGLGALTLPLSQKVKQVVGIETDSGLVRFHEQKNDLPGNVRLIHQDILKTDLEELAAACGTKLKIVANLPYSISSPFLFRLIDHAEFVDWAVIMLQKEVALRLAAEPGTKEYGAPTVLMAGCATVTPLMKVKAAEFYPPPKVDSMVVRLAFLPLPDRVASSPPFDRKLFRLIVNGAFGKRRKTLLNALSSSGLGPDKKNMAEIITQAGLTTSERAERLSFEHFVALTNCLKSYQASHNRKPTS
jgi:16S rRNA (adenine1518-N6/adenine1519-N6)-dimethyltransferase